MPDQYQYKILVVDDIPTNIEFVHDALETEDFEVIGVNSGLEALEAVENDLPDLILLDVLMPKMDGFEVCKRLKANARTKDIPVIFLTARVDDEDIVKGFETGAVDYIAKPFNFSELCSRVNTHLELKTKTEELIHMNQKLEELVNERTAQLKKANEELIHANEQLSILDTSKNNFISHINHELRTPLNGILGYTSLLMEDPDDEDNYKYIKAINSLTDRLIKLAEIALLFTELRANEFDVQVTDVQLTEIINAAVDGTETAEKKLSLYIENPDEQITVKAESKLLISCVSIILDNAIKYSPVNGKVLISVKPGKESVTIDISDDGPGFSEKAKQSIFDALSADNQGYNSHGFGLGLPTAKIILDIFKGEIDIQNKADKGAVVSLQLKY